jgi:molybdopterin molybdotransferase
MIPVAEALARVLALAPAPQIQDVALADAAGRVLLRPARAGRDQPPFASSAMDGYAVTDPVEPGHVLAIIGESRAGARFEGKLGPGQAVRIFTGAPIPVGATRVVIQEDVSRDGDRITLGEAMSEGRNIRPQGGDFAQGFELAAPRRLRAPDLALLAAMNCPRLSVARRPVVALIATGDELVMPGEIPGPDQIIASNSFALKAMAESEGALVRMLPIARDTPEALGDILTLCEGADVIVTIGGASVGDHDLVAQVTQSRGMERAFYKVAMRPGKPLMAGRMGAAVLLGLPGNPVSAIVCGHLFLVPLLRAMQGLPDPGPHPLRATLARALPANGPRAHYMRARLLAPSAGGQFLTIEPFDDQDSSRLQLLSHSAALLIRPPHDPPRQGGDSIDYLPL